MLVTSCLFTVKETTQTYVENRSLIIQTGSNFKPLIAAANRTHLRSYLCFGASKADKTKGPGHGVHVPDCYSFIQNLNTDYSFMTCVICEALKALL